MQRWVYICLVLLSLVVASSLALGPYAARRAIFIGAYDKGLKTAARTDAWLPLPLAATRNMAVGSYTSGKGSSLPLVIYFHGNAESALSGSGSAILSRAFGADVVAVEYRGYGPGAGGRMGPSFSLYPSDAYLQLSSIFSPGGHAGRDPSRKVIVYGFSLGGAIALGGYHAADPFMKAKLSNPRVTWVLDSTFSDTLDIVPQFTRAIARVLSWGQASIDSRRRASALARSGARIFVLSSKGDSVVPYWSSSRLARSAGVSVTEGVGDHCNLSVEHPPVLKAVLDGAGIRTPI